MKSKRFYRVLAYVALLATATPVFAQVGAPPPAIPAPQGGLVDLDNDPAQWPMRVASPSGGITIFQPQLEDFQGDMLSARAAISVDDPRQQQPVYGAVWIESRVSTDRTSRMVRTLGINVSRARFPGADPATEQSLTAAIRQALAAQPMTLSLDQLLAMLQSVQKEQAVTENFQTAPPIIIFRDHPAVKVQYDGAPRMVQVANSPLLRVVNTPFFVVLDPPSRSYFLKGGGRWYAAPDPMGPFRDATGVPAAVAALADATDYKDPQQAITNTAAPGIEIITASEPTELVWSDGNPQMGTVPGTDLLYVTNTPSDMFLQIDTQQIYVVLAGRWYVAPSRNGPWAFVPPDKLPEDFRRIPANSDKGDILAHVAGTQAAQDAIADTYVPQTATVNRVQFDQPVVNYDGDPRFEPVAGIPVTYAVNCDGAILQTGGNYYCCYNAVWYTSRVAVGPWGLCTVIPAEIYQLPPSCPIYSVRYVHVYGYTPEVVYVGYTPGYVGCYTYDRVVVYGTGYHYNPWFGRVYYPRPCTYGYAPRYNGYVGQWGFNFGLAAGTGGARWVGEGPRSWGREGLWFGFGGYRPVVRHEDVHVDLFRNQYLNRVRDGRPPQPQPIAQRDQYSRNLYERRNDVKWDRPVARGPERVVDRAPDRGPTRGPSTPARGNGGRPEEVIKPATPARREEPRNDVFTDRSGNVYRKTVDGWEGRDGNQWKPANPNARATGPLPDARTDADARRETEANNAAEARRQADLKRQTGSRGGPAGQPSTPARGPEARTIPQPPVGQPSSPQRGPEARSVPQPPAGSRSGPGPNDPRQTPSRGADSAGKDRADNNQPTRQPPAGRNDPNLNQDYRSRIAGNDRLRNYEKPDSPTPGKSK